MVNYINFDQIKAYQIASTVSDRAWNSVAQWNWQAQSTLGSQWIRSTDSIAANIAEGFGRYHKKDKIKFYYNSRGSTNESTHWCQNAYDKLIYTLIKNEIMLELHALPKEINTLIKITELKLKQ